MRLIATTVLLGCAMALAACGTSEEEEVRAVVQEFRRAVDEDDGARACRLLTARAARAVANCPQNVASVDPGGSDDGTVAVDGTRATVAGRIRLVKVDGSWRIDALGPGRQTSAGRARTAAYERCWRAAGARIATTPKDLAFAGADVPVVAVRADRVSAKGGDWRIFYTLPPDRRDPGIAEVIADPQAAGVVAYVRDARARSGVVERARDCPDGG